VAAAITLTELVDEYLQLHQAERVTIAKLRWLLRKATSMLGDKRVADLSPKDVYGWRSTLPAVRLVGADRGRCRAAWTGVRADGRVRDRDRAAAIGAVRA
jgi:hypothetical protein